MAGVGNVLRRDDGFGVVVADRLMREPVPDRVRVLEFGIGGIHLVQELLDPFDALVAIDAVDLGRPAGTLMVMRPEVLDVTSLSPPERHDQLADVHYATPERAFMLAAALQRLPVETWVVGCQVADADEYGEGLSPAVEHAVEPAIAEVRGLVSTLGVHWEQAVSDSPRRVARGEEVAMGEERDTQKVRKTEQGDDLTEEHSIATEEGRPENPYQPARQPAQEEPGEGGEEGKDTGF